MSLNDVWRNVNQEVGIFWKSRWDDVPSGPGVYAWFYPLRISTRDLNSFLHEVRTVLSFDAKCNGPAWVSLTAPFTWDTIDMEVRLGPSDPPIPSNVALLWDQVVADEVAFERMRRVVMRGSLFMPPLYVGKAQSLSTRCQQHRSGTASNDFHNRYQDFAEKMKLPAETVNDLLFACVRTTNDSPAGDDAIEGIVEEILKRACRPKYSVK